MVGKKMYRVSKVLNNNGIIAINMEENRNMYFWEKVWDLERRSASVLRLRQTVPFTGWLQETERGSAKELAKSVAPEFLEIADEILREADEDLWGYHRQKDPVSPC